MLQARPELPRPNQAQQQRALAANVTVEELQYHTDDGPQGWVPLRVVSPPRSGSGDVLRSAVVFLHGTGEA